MSYEDIIASVTDKPEIWMTSHPHFKNKTVTKRIWMDLSEQLGVGEDTLKKRWKHLKDQYRKVLKRQMAPKSGDGTSDLVSTWKYYDAMYFLRDELMPNATTGDLIEVSADLDDMFTTSSCMGRQDNSLESFAHAQSPVSVDGGFHVESSTLRKRSASTSHGQEMIELERKKLALMEQEFHQELNRDEDYLYLMSILPSMKKLNDIQKLRFRGRINDWLLAEMTAREAL